MEKLYLWLNVNRLSLNIEKTNYIIFHAFNKPIKQKLQIQLNGKTITEKDCIKYLGILVDSSLSWKQQVSNVSKKISRSIGIMYKLRPYLPLNVMKSIYYSLVYSHLIYAIEVWGAAFKTELNKLFVLQKRAVRLMTYKDNFPLHPGPLSHTEPLNLSFII